MLQAAVYNIYFRKRMHSNWFFGHYTYNFARGSIYRMFLYAGIFQYKFELIVKNRTHAPQVSLSLEGDGWGYVLIR